MRRKRSSERQLVEQICSRLMRSLEADFVLSPSAISKRLGYANSSTVTQIRKGLTIPDPARLAAFAERLAAEEGRTINLHWVLTGKGAPVIGTEGENDINKLLARLRPSQRNALITILAGLQHQGDAEGSESAQLAQPGPDDLSAALQKA